ncbi:unnamed protein product [Gadus morhua 'NCC']
MSNTLGAVPNTSVDDLQRFAAPMCLTSRWFIAVLTSCGDQPRDSGFFTAERGDKDGGSVRRGAGRRARDYSITHRGTRDRRTASTHHTPRRRAPQTTPDRTFNG